MLRTFQNVLLGLLVICTSITNAQDISLGNPEYQNTIRVEFDRSPDLPVGVAFNNTLRLLDDLNEENPAYALYYLQDEMEFDETDDAE